MAYVINPDLCMACGTCQGECPTGAIKEGDVYSIDADVCIDCGTSMSASTAAPAPASARAKRSLPASNFRKAN